jgi:hypothetical protein
MTDHEEDTAEQPDSTPNFELPRHGAIREDNWPEYEARGFQPIMNSDGSLVSIGVIQDSYGTAHVYTGDAYDGETGRPLRHKPGTGLYTDPEGVKFSAEHERAWEEWHRQREERQRQSDGGAGTS